MYSTKNPRKSRKNARFTPFFIRRLSSWLVLSTALTLGAAKVAHAATYVWDPDTTAAGNNATTGAGLGGNGTWDTSSLSWWDGVSADVAWTNGLFDTAVFTGTGGTVTIGSSIDAGALVFNTDGYTVTGGTLNLGGAATITVAADDRATVSSIIAGSSGLTKTGNGTLVLTNTGNTFSGDVVIQSGALVINDQGELGTGTTVIGVFGVAQTGNPGYSGGSLVLAGTTSSGSVTISRDISVSGRGPGAANSSGGLISVGQNTISGNLTMGSAISEGRANAVYGNTTVTGGVTLGTGNLAYFGGNGNWIISGKVTGD